MPEVYGAVWRAHGAGDVERARRLFNRYFPLIRLTNQPGIGPRMVKLLLHRAGIIKTTYTRGPAPPLDPATERAVLEAAENSISSASWPAGPCQLPDADCGS